jgi:hypothetical protein
VSLGAASGPNGGQSQTVPLQPVPTLVTVGQCQNAQGTMVILQMATPVGLAVYFLTPDAAIQVGQTLRQCGKASKSGLVLPGESELG